MRGDNFRAPRRLASDRGGPFQPALLPGATIEHRRQHPGRPKDEGADRRHGHRPRLDTMSLRRHVRAIALDRSYRRARSAAGDAKPVTASSSFPWRC